MINTFKQLFDLIFSQSRYSIRNINQLVSNSFNHFIRLIHFLQFICSFFSSNFIDYNWWNFLFFFFFMFIHWGNFEERFCCIEEWIVKFWLFWCWKKSFLRGECLHQFSFSGDFLSCLRNVVRNLSLYLKHLDFWVWGFSGDKLCHFLRRGIYRNMLVIGVKRVNRGYLVRCCFRSLKVCPFFDRCRSCDVFSVEMS